MAKIKRKAQNKIKQRGDKKEVCEIFKVNKGKKEKSVELCGEVEAGKEKTSKHVKEAEKKQLFYAVIIMAAVLVLFFAAYAMFQQSKKFEYNGFKFEKIMYDKLPLYYTKISITRMDGNIINYNLYLRNDPRKNNIESDAFVQFMRGTIFVSLNKDFEKCEDTNLAMTNIGMLFGAIGLDLRGALDNLEQAETLKRPYVTCENTKNNTVILYTEADKTSIIQQGDCYAINVANCGILNATEAFIMQVLSDMQKRP